MASAWGLDVESVEYAAIGYGSHHWYTSGSGSRWLVTADHADERPLVADFVPALLAAPEATPDLEVAVDWVRKLLPL